ncbi:hypothetical protein EVG20_g11716, partial [Dentipellis fragilis]
METTPAWLKDGEMVGVGRGMSTAFSSAYTSSWPPTTGSSPPAMSAVRTTQQTGHREGTIPPDTSSSHLSQSLLSWSRSSPISTPPSTQASPAPAAIQPEMCLDAPAPPQGSRPLPPRAVETSGAHTSSQSSIGLERHGNPSCLGSNRPRPVAAQRSAAPRQPLLPSALRPPCRARERLKLWKPAHPSALAAPLTEQDIERVFAVLGVAWQDSTLETYGSGLYAYHTFCDERRVPEDMRAPAHEDILTTFLAGLAGIYAKSTITNYFAGIRAWHLLHRQPWHFDAARLDLLIRGAIALAPPTSKRPPRDPYTIQDLLAIHRQLRLEQPLDAAVWAAATSLFYGIARTGELIVRAASGPFIFAPSRYPTPQDVSNHQDSDGHSITNIRLPWSKSMRNGVQECIFWAPQADTSDPAAALRNHQLVNAPQPGEHLFAYKDARGQRIPLTKHKFTMRLRSACLAAGVIYKSGHGFRIGGTLW